MTRVNTLTEIDIKEKTKKFIRSNFLLGDETKTLDDNESLLEKGIIDSTGVLELVEFIQETFKIKVEDEEMLPDNLDSLNNVAAFVNSKFKNI